MEINVVYYFFVVDLIHIASMRKIIKHHIVGGTRESHPHIHDLYHPLLGKPRRGLQIMDSDGILESLLQRGERFYYSRLRTTYHVGRTFDKLLIAHGLLPHTPHPIQGDHVCVCWRGGEGSIENNLPCGRGIRQTPDCARPPPSYFAPYPGSAGGGGRGQFRTTYHVGGAFHKLLIAHGLLPHTSHPIQGKHAGLLMRRHYGLDQILGILNHRQHLVRLRVHGTLVHLLDYPGFLLLWDTSKSDSC